MTTAARIDFDPYSDDYFRDPYDTYRRLRDDAPVFQTDAYGGFYALSRYEDVAEAYRDVATFSSASGILLEHVLSENQIPPVLVTMDPPDHDRVRSLVSKVFTARAITALEPMLKKTIDGFLSASDGKDEFDAVAEFAALFPVEVIMTMLGVPEEFRQTIRLKLDSMLTRAPGQSTVSDAGMQAQIEIGTIYYNLVVEKRQRLGADMISRLIQAEYKRDDGSITQLDDVEIAGFASLLGGAGSETVTKLVGNAAVLFSEHPDQWQALVKDPSRIPGAVEEVLRYQAPVQYVYRQATRDVTLHGTTIPKGAPVALLIGSAGRDERQFAEPDRFDIERVNPSPIRIGFGYGPHFCLGASLARMECRLAFEGLLRRMPQGFTVDQERCQRVAMTNVAGYSRVPVHPLEAAKV